MILLLVLEATDGGGGGVRLFGRMQPAADAPVRIGACACTGAADAGCMRWVGQGGKRADVAGIVQATCRLRLRATTDRRPATPTA